MVLHKVLKLVLLLLGVSFVILQAMSQDKLSAGISALSFILLIVLYYIVTKQRNNFFFFALIVFAFAQLITFISWFTPEIQEYEIDFPYYTTNTLYIIFYILLSVKVINDLDIKLVTSKYILALIVLFIMSGFCISTFAITTENVLTDYQYVLELVYNITIMFLLSCTVINYIHRNDNKSLLFLAGCTSIFFSEIIQFAYFYILEYNSSLGFIYAAFLLLAFIFFYLQSQISYTEENTFLS